MSRLSANCAYVCTEVGEHVITLDSLGRHLLSVRPLRDRPLRHHRAVTSSSSVGGYGQATPQVLSIQPSRRSAVGSSSTSPRHAGGSRPWLAGRERVVL